MLTKQEYETIEQKVCDDANLIYWNHKKFIEKELILKFLKEYVHPDQGKQEEQNIDCDAINKALQDGKITFVRSEHGVAVVPSQSPDCYVKSDETDQEQWDRLDGHQRCVKAAVDAARKIQELGLGYRKQEDQDKILKSGSLTIRKNENGKYEYVSETQSDIDAGTVWDVLERLERLEKGFGTIATIILQQHTFAPFHDIQNNITKLREMINEE